MPMSEHIVTSYDQELALLGRKIAEMGGIAESMLADAMDSLAGLNVELAQRVVAADPRLDALQRDIEEHAILTIARRQPMAVDLREIVAAIRVSGDLERVGDLAKNISKRAMKIAAEARMPRAIVGLKHMNDLAAMQLKDVLDAYGQRDPERAKAVWLRDAELDALEDSVFRDLLTFMMEDPRNISFCTHLLFCSKNIERVGDLAKNIGKRAMKIAAETRLPRAIIGLKHMNDLAAMQLKDVLDAYAQRDPERAKAVWLRDAELDALEDSVFRDLLTFMMEDPRNISFCTHLLFCSKNIERVGDHATNIAETVVYLVTGNTLPMERPKGRSGFSSPFAADAAT